MRSMSRHRNFDQSGSFEQLCRRVEGIVVESRHPYPKVIPGIINRSRLRFRRSDSLRYSTSSAKISCFGSHNSEWRPLAVYVPS